MFENLIKATWRNLWRNRSYTALNILGLSVGIACAGLIFLWRESELNFDSVHLDKDHLYLVEVNKDFSGNTFTMSSTPRPMASAIKAEIPGIVNAARFSDTDVELLFQANNTSLYASGRYADASLFSMFSFEFLEGSVADPFPSLHSVILTRQTAQKFFGSDKNVTGKTIRIGNQQDYIVSGVIKDMPENSTLQFEWLIPYQVVVSQLAKDIYEWGSYGPLTYVQLAPNANVSAVNGKLKDFIHRKAPGETAECFLYPMKDWRLYDEFANGRPTGGGRIEQVRSLTLIAWILLLIACINFMNLATAQGEKRAKEVGMRKVLGVERKWLMAQFLGDAFVMSAMAMVVSVLIMYLSLPLFNQIMQTKLSLGIGNPSHIGSLLAITVICGVVAGSYPSIFLSSFDPISVIKGMKMKDGGVAMLRKTLVVVQITVSVIFIIGSMVVYAQIRHARSRDLGFNKENLIEINPKHDIASVFPALKQDLLAEGAIENAALAGHATLVGGDTDDRFKWQGKPDDQKVVIAHRQVSAEFIATSGMKILEGRDFVSSSPAERLNVIINASMAKLLGSHSAVGKVIQSPRGNPDGVFTNMTVIGVVNDFIYGDVYGHSGPLIMTCTKPEYQNFIYVRIKEGKDVVQAISSIEKVMKTRDPAYPLDFRFVDDQFDQMFKSESRTGQVVGVFAILAVMISSLGMLGLSAYTAQRKVKEISVRKVLGASVRSIVSMLSKEFIRLVYIGCLVAFPISWWLVDQWLRSYTYRIDLNFGIFLLAGGVAMGVTFFTVSFQAIKAALVNPIKNMRSE